MQHTETGSRYEWVHRESVVNLHSEYQKGVNFGFKTMLFSFKSRFEQRFDYLNKQALSLSNVELSQKKELAGPAEVW